MRELKHIVSIYIRDDLDILNCKHKQALVLSNIKRLQNGLDENYIIGSYFVKNTDKVSCISTTKRIKGFESLSICTNKSSFNKLIPIKLKDRKQIERKHFLIIFSTDEDKLLANENNYSYFYNLGNLLTGDFIDEFLDIIKEKTK